MIPSHGRVSGSPATAWAMIGLAMLIGMAKKMPWASCASAVLTPTTSPSLSISGPPLVARVDRRVGLDQVAQSALLARDRVGHDERATKRRDDARCDAVGESPERAADDDRRLAGFELARIADWRRRQVGRIDLDDRQIGQRVYAVDRAVHGPAVVKLDRHVVASETTWRLVST